jgi:hypothetical protein
MTSAPFRFLHEPRTEQEVVGVFVAILDEVDAFPKPVVIERIHGAFPDCRIRAAGVPIKIEFKLYAESYNYELDDSVLVCWKKGKERRWPPSFRVVELAPIVETKRPDLIMFNDHTYEHGPWGEHSFFTDACREDCSEPAIRLMREITRWAGEAGLGPLWKRDPKPQFDVGRDKPFFTVWSDGRLRLVLKRLIGTTAVVTLLDDLNRVAPSLDLSLNAVKQKKRLVLVEHFSDDGSLRSFLRVWEKFDKGRGANQP